MPDQDGYPTEHELESYKTWGRDGDFPPCYEALLETVQENWWMGGSLIASEERLNRHGDPVVRFSVSTGGWSGNEDVIGALSQNFLFWSQCFVQRNVGGHFIFEVLERNCAVRPDYGDQPERPEPFDWGALLGGRFEFKIAD